MCFPVHINHLFCIKRLGSEACLLRLLTQEHELIPLNYGSCDSCSIKHPGVLLLFHRTVMNNAALIFAHIIV